MKPFPKYQPQMDGLRAMAVLAVLLHHFDGPFNTLFNFGTLGVRLFFVMSGFLITRVLFKARDRHENGESTWGQEMGSFQLRRLLRTLPVYYLSLLIAILLAIPPVRETIFWTLSFLTNFYMARLDYFPDTISHFWSLAVQEQFYLFWPFLIFFLPRPFIKYSFPALIVIAILFRLYCIEHGVSNIIRWFSLPGNLECFAVGGFLAHVSLTRPRLIEKNTTRLSTGLLSAGAICGATKLRYLPLENHWTIWTELLEASAIGWLVACSVTGFNGVFGRILSWGPITYIGRISYGIYIFHVLVSILLLPVFTSVGLGGNDFLSYNIRFFARLVVTLLVAGFSWHFIEQPISRARNRITAWFLPRPALAKKRPALSSL